MSLRLIARIRHHRRFQIFKKRQTLQRLDILGLAKVAPVSKVKLSNQTSCQVENFLETTDSSTWSHLL